MVSRTRERGTSIPANSVVLGKEYINSKYYKTPPQEVWVYANTKYYPLMDVRSWNERTTDELHPGPPYLSGGPFSNWEYLTDECVPKQIGVYKAPGGTSYRYKYEGGFACGVRLLDSIRDFEDDAITNVEEYGATGWNRFRPNRPSADLGVFLGELRDLPRMLRTTAKGFHDLWRSMGGSRTGFGPKSVANHWLNTQFGWLPFLNDLRKFHKTTQTLDRRLAQLRRDNGQWVKRSGTVLQEDSKESTEGSVVSSAHYPLLNSYYHPTLERSGRYSYVTRTYRRVWFEARFRYWMPWLARANWYPRAVAYMYGLRISPSVLWELTPWSWLIDWCSNAGDVIENVTSMAYDNLAAKYAYVMANAKREVELTSSLELTEHGIITTSWSASSERKVRREASPFGFGLTGSMFTARQWSILSALGLSRLKY